MLNIKKISHMPFIYDQVEFIFQHTWIRADLEG